MARQKGTRKPRPARRATRGPAAVVEPVARVTEPPVEDEDEPAQLADDGEPQGEPAEGELEDVAVPGDDTLPLVASEEADDEPGERGEPAPVDREQERARRDLVRHDPLTAYVQEIRRYPLLSREEEHELAVRYYETGDVEIAHKLVTANLRLVVKIAHEYRRAYRNLLDLVQEGNVGLMQAVRKYDPFRGVKLSSYAAWWIRAYILKFILANWRLVKIGTTQAQRKLFFNLRKEKEKLERLGFQPEHRLLAERLDVSEHDVAEMERRLESAEMSLDAPVSRDDEGGRTRMDALPGTVGGRPDVAAESGEFRRILREKLEDFGRGLEGRDLTLYRERWLSESPKTLQDIGDQFGISRERARQIEKRLLDRLRVYLERELGGAVDIGAIGSEE